MPRSPGKPQLTYTGKAWRLRFTHDGVRHDFKTSVIREHEEARAHRWMANRLEYVYSGEWKSQEVAGNDPNAKLSEVAAAYLTTKGGGEITERTAELHKRHLKVHLLKRFARLSDVTRGSLATYQAHRLKSVQYETVKKELSTLRQVLKFAEERGWIGDLPRFPAKPKKSLGTKARQAPSGFTDGFTAAMARKLIPLLPELSRKNRKTKEQWPLRTYFEVMFESSLRPGLWDKFRVGVHWHPGQKHLNVTSDIDKNRWARKVPLSQHAARQLEEAYSSEVKRLGEIRNGGQLFASLDFRNSLRAAAKAAGIPAHIAARVKPYDMRHARGTELMNTTGQTLGVGFLMGHKQATTTNRYSHADEHQASEVLRRMADSGADSGARDEGPKAPKNEQSKQGKKPVKTECEERDLNPHGSYPTSTSRAEFRRNHSEIPGLKRAKARQGARSSGHSGASPTIEHEADDESEEGAFRAALTEHNARAEAYRVRTGGGQ